MDSVTLLHVLLSWWQEVYHTFCRVALQSGMSLNIETLLKKQSRVILDWRPEKSSAWSLLSRTEEEVRPLAQAAAQVVPVKPKSTKVWKGRHLSGSSEPPSHVQGC